MKYKAIIIDDEPKLREVLTIKLNDKCPKVEIVAKCENAEQGYAAIIEHKPDLIFLDISMPGESGFDLLNRFEVLDFEIIFVTGFNEYGLDALKLSAVDYLLKPVKTEDLVRAVHKAFERIDTQSKIEKYENLLNNINNISDQNSNIAIPGVKAYEFIKIKEVVRCEGWQKYTKIHLLNEEVIVSSYNIGKFKDMLDSYGFYETHKSHLINTTHIKKYLKEGIVVMSNGDQVPVSRRKKEEFISFFIK